MSENQSKLAAALGYPKFKHEPRVLILDTEYLVVRDIQAGAALLGWSAFSLKTPRKGFGSNQFIADLLTALVTHRPDFVVTINHLGFDANGVLAKLLEQYHIPVASWFVDHPVPVLGGADDNATSNLQVFCFERTAFDWLKSCGYEEPVYLPTGSNQQVFHPHRIDQSLISRFTHPLTFAASSWWPKARREPSKKVRKQARAMVSRYGVGDQQLAKTLVSSKDKGRAFYAVAQVALAEASMQMRKRFVNKLASAKLLLYGDDGWNQLCPNVPRRPYLDYQTELPALFVASAINANITAEQMPTAVNQRVWDVPGVGGVLLTDRRDDATEVFTEDEMIFYDSMDEAADKVAFYRDKPALRKKMGERAFARVEAGHRITHRMTTLYKMMKKRFG